VRWLAKCGSEGLAIQVLKKWHKKQRRTDPEAALLEADLLIERGQRTRAHTLLTSLSKHRIKTVRAGAMLRLAQIATFRYQYRKARELYAEVIEKFPDTPDAVQAEFEAAELEFDSDQYDVAAEKMRVFAERHTSGKFAAKAAWLAGFSAHLAGSSTVAIAAFEKFLADDPYHQTAPRARYWLARELEEIGERERAGEMYAALVERTPLGYYGLLADQRLQSMGVSAALDPLPPVPSPQSVNEVVSLLGPERPLGIDRAAALFSANLKREGVEELVGLADHFRKTGDTQGATLVVDLFQIFGKDAWAFLLARHITQGDDPDDLERRPYYWRVWRHAFPTPFEEEVRVASTENELDPFLLYSVMRTESLFRPESVSPVGARGLMQIMPATARWIGKKDRKARPHAKRYKRSDSNIWLGAWYVRFLLDHYERDVAKALGAYNAGPAAMDRWLRRFSALEPDEFNERIPYDETRAYVRRAMESYLVYQRLHPAPSVAQREEPDTSSGS
jgi:soluble lytic murein transglycosylase